MLETNLGLSAKDYSNGQIGLTYVAGEGLGPSEMDASLVGLSALTYAKYINHQLRTSDGILGRSPITNPLHDASRTLHTTINQQTAEKAEAVAQYGPYILVIGENDYRNVPLSYGTLARFENQGPRPVFAPRSINRMSDARQPERITKPVKQISTFLLLERAVKAWEWTAGKLRFGSARAVGSVALSR